MRWRSTDYALYTEHYDSPEEQFAADASRVTEVIDVRPPAGTALTDKQVRLNAYSDFLGYPSVQSAVLNVVGGGTATRPYISRVTPKPYAAYLNRTGKPFLYCKSIPRSKPLGVVSNDTVTNTGNAPLFRMALSYLSLPYTTLEDGEVTAVGIGIGVLASRLNPLVDNQTGQGLPDEGSRLAASGILGTRYISKTVEPGGKFFTLRQGLLRMVDGSASPDGLSGGTPIHEGLPVSIPFAMVTYTWHEIPVAAIPSNAISKCMGAVNRDAFDGYPVETMLMMAPRLRFYNDPFGNRTVDISYPFKVQFNISYSNGSARGHNWVLRVFNGALDYQKLTSTGLFDGQPPYRSVDFTTLFRPDQV